jgi:hypothetical protein
MNDPKETLDIQIDADRTARLEIQIITEPAIPTPNERSTTSTPTARELDLVGIRLAARNYTFPK